MNRQNRTFWVVLTFVVGLLSLLIWRGKSHYNELIATQNQVETQWLQVANHYERYLQIASSLDEWLQLHPVQKENIKIETELTSFKQLNLKDNTDENLKLLRARHQNLDAQIRKINLLYPKEIAEDRTLKNLWIDWEGINNRISIEANRKYNPVVAAYQTSMESYPNNLYAPFLPVKKFALYGEK